MYKILGADQKEYGPVSLEQLRQWLAEGRVNAQTLAQAEGTTGWKPLAAYPELAPLLTAAPSTTSEATATPPGAGWPQPAPLPAGGPYAPAFDAQRVIKTPAVLLMIAGALGVLGSLFAL